MRENMDVIEKLPVRTYNKVTAEAVIRRCSSK